MTSYVVLTQTQTHDEVGEPAVVWSTGDATLIDASSAEQAVRKHADTAGAGTYVAIPARQFKPLTVQVETVQRVKIGGAA